MCNVEFIVWNFLRRKKVQSDKNKIYEYRSKSLKY